MFVTYSSKKPDYYLYFGRTDPLKPVIEYKLPVAYTHRPHRKRRRRSRSRRRQEKNAYDGTFDRSHRSGTCTLSLTDYFKLLN